jgi:hypothetical protein
VSIVQAGIQFTAADLQKVAGNTAFHIFKQVQAGNDLATQLATWTDQDLIELGLGQEEIDAIKGFYVGDLPTIVQALQASSWLKKLLGTGVTSGTGLGI